MVVTETTRNRRLLGLALDLLALAAFAASLLGGWMFYVFYYKWTDLFENGRYFDPESEVVYHDGSFVIGVIAAALLLSSLVLWLAGRKIKAGPRG